MKKIITILAVSAVFAMTAKADDRPVTLEQLPAKGGVPSTLVPVQIKDYVDRHYHDVVIREYEVGRRTYEIQLSNGMELKFNRNFVLVGIDD